MPDTGRRSNHRKAPPRRRMDSIAWLLLAIGVAMVAISTCVIVVLNLRVPPDVADGMKPVLYTGALFMFTSIGAKTSVLDRLKLLLGG